MEYKLTKLKNGVRVLTVPMPSLESVATTVWVKTGSRYEEAKINGISHFLEHMVFKGSKKRPTAKAISEVVDSIGGEFNAATGKESTDFYIKCRAGNIDIAFDVLSDMVLNPLLKEEEIEKEKGTIIEEIKMYEDTPIFNIGHIFEDLIFEGHPLGREVSGSEDSVKGIKRNDFDIYRKMHYYSENILISAAGKVSEEKVKELAEKHFGDLKPPSSSESSNQKFIPKQTKPKVKIHDQKKEQAHFIMAFLADGHNYEGRFTQNVLLAILSEGMSSRLFIEIRERRGLAYAVKGTLNRYEETGYLGAYAGVDPSKIDESIKVMADQFYGIASGKYPITKKELTKAREYLKGHLALEFEDTHSVGDFFGEQVLFLDKIQSLEEVYKEIDKVKIEDLIFESKRLFVPEKLNLAIIGPYKDSSRFEKLLG